MRTARFALLAFVIPCVAQQDFTSGTIRGVGGFSVRYETRMEPAGTLPLRSGNRSFSSTPADLVFERYLTDASRKTYFGYRVTVLAPEGPYSQVTFSRLPMSAELAQSAGITDPGEWTYLGVEEGTTKVVRVGDALDLELLRNPRTGQRLIERITVLSQGGLNMPSASKSVHDLSVDDIELYFEEPRMILNGQEEVLSGLPRGSFTELAISIRNKGRYVLSLAPRPGFTKAGEVSGNSLSFRLNQDAMFVFSRARIVPGRGRYNLYVKHDPSAQVIRNAWGSAILSGGR